MINWKWDKIKRTRPMDKDNRPVYERFGMTKEKFLALNEWMLSLPKRRRMERPQ